MSQFYTGSLTQLMFADLGDAGSEKVFPMTVNAVCTNSAIRVYQGARVFDAL